MIYSLAQRQEAPRMLARLSRSQVPVAAVLASVAFGFIATALELLYPDKVLPALLNVVGSTCLLVWTLSLLSQLILRRRAAGAGTALPFKMWAFPYVTYLGLGILALVFVLALMTPGPRVQLLSTVGLTLCIAAVSEIARRVRARG